MTESEDTDAEQKNEETEESDEQTLFRERVTTIMMVVSGVIAAFVSYNTVGLETVSGLLPVAPFALIVLIFTKYKFNRFSAKTVAYVFLIITVVWYITGTFLLQLM